MKKSSTNTPKKKATEDPKMVMKPLSLVQGKYKFNLYQTRIELYIVNEAQAAIRGERHIAGRKLPSDGLHPIVEIPLRLILQDEDESNYAIVKKSAKAMAGKVIDYVDADETYVVFSPIITVKIPRYSPTMSVEVHRDMWNAILDYRKGWRKFDINAALSLKSVHSIKLYELISLHTDERYFSVDELKEFFGVKEKYKLTADFIRYVLEPVKKELDESSPWTFDYEVRRQGKSERSKVLGFAIKPHANGAKALASERKDLARNTHLSHYVKDYKAREYLYNSMGFTKDEVCNEINLNILGEAFKVIPDFIGTLAILNGKSRTKKTPKGWILNALRGKVADYYKSINQPNPLEGLLKKSKSGQSTMADPKPAEESPKSVDFDSIANNLLNNFSKWKNQ